MTILTTGYPLLDLGIALVIGYSLSWLFVTRRLRRALDTAESRMYAAETENRTAHRDLVKVREEAKSLRSELATVREQLTKAERDLNAANEEKSTLAPDLEERANRISELETELAIAQEQRTMDKSAADSQISDLQRQLQIAGTNSSNINNERAQAEKRALEAKIAAYHVEGAQLRANLNHMATESDSLKWRVSALQAENQLLRTQSSSVLSELETLLWRLSPMLRRSQENTTVNDQWLRGNLNVDASRQVVPHLVDQNGSQEDRPPVAE